MKLFISISFLISFILDYLLFNFISYSFYNISFIFPMFFLCTCILLFKYLSSHNYYIYLIFIILYSSIFLGNIILGLILFFSIYFLSKLFKTIPIFLSTIFLLFIYDLLFYLILIIFLDYSFSLDIYLYKIVRSFIINFIFIIIYNLVLEKKYS